MGVTVTAAMAMTVAVIVRLGLTTRIGVRVVVVMPARVIVNVATRSSGH
jgi:hypothetical protein